MPKAYVAHAEDRPDSTAASLPSRYDEGWEGPTDVPGARRLRRPVSRRPNGIRLDTAPSKPERHATGIRLMTRYAAFLRGV
ncbi:MAG: hypothetical protein ACRDUT_17575, partial [Mycobacterium sp.]